MFVCVLFSKAIAALFPWPFDKFQIFIMTLWLNSFLFPAALRGNNFCDVLPKFAFSVPSFGWIRGFSVAVVCQNSLRLFDICVSSTGFLRDSLTILLFFQPFFKTCVSAAFVWRNSLFIRDICQNFVFILLTFRRNWCFWDHESKFALFRGFCRNLRFFFRKLAFTAVLWQNSLLVIFST